jgi:hypothetical protein
MLNERSEMKHLLRHTTLIGDALYKQPVKFNPVVYICFLKTLYHAYNSFLY